MTQGAGCTIVATVEMVADHAGMSGTACTIVTTVGMVAGHAGVTE